LQATTAARPAAVWIGYDTPRKLGDREEPGGGSSLPVWISFMETALKNMPISDAIAPEGVLLHQWRLVLRGVRRRSGGVTTLGVGNDEGAAQPEADGTENSPSDSSRN
jgi:penicillin-binding protein 1A